MKTKGFDLKDFVIALVLGLIIPPLPFVVGFIFFNWNFVGDDLALWTLSFLYATNSSLLTYQLYVKLENVK
ncbi:MAG: hypothetical protein D8H97_20735 [Neisseria sp.]|nr:MAG: hypothetical protein D8H97_20735 [Neisseria sp.]